KVIRGTQRPGLPTPYDLDPPKRRLTRRCRVLVPPTRASLPPTPLSGLRRWLFQSTSAHSIQSQVRSFQAVGSSTRPHHRLPPDQPDGTTTAAICMQQLAIACQVFKGLTYKNVKIPVFIGSHDKNC